MRCSWCKGSALSAELPPRRGGGCAARHQHVPTEKRAARCSQTPFPCALEHLFSLAQLCQGSSPAKSPRIWGSRAGTSAQALWLLSWAAHSSVATKGSNLDPVSVGIPLWKADGANSCFVWQFCLCYWSVGLPNLQLSAEPNLLCIGAPKSELAGLVLAFLCVLFPLEYWWHCSQLGDLRG